MAQASSLEYSTWKDARTGLTVEYSLPVFYELEFTIGEAFRRIPHGGIETGVLLVGERTADGVRIDSFRPIECEHASGPSFNLSERDLEKLREQLRLLGHGREDVNSAVLGWCIAHTRSDVALNARERELFDELFPGPRELTIIAKPERFKPTRFGFFIRDADGAYDSNAADSSLVLPPPPKNARRGNRVSEPEPIIARPAREAKTVEPAELFQDVLASEPELTTETTGMPPIAEEATPATSDVTDETTARSAPALEEITAPAAITAPPNASAAAPHPQMVLHPLPLRAAKRRSPADVFTWIAAAAAVVIAAIAGYGFYLRSAGESIPITVTPHGTTIIASWPVSFTHNADSVAVRINGGAPIPLSPPQKRSGTYALNGSGGDIRIEVDVEHWYGTTRGIIRYLASPVALGSPAGAAKTTAGTAARANPRPSSAAVSPRP